MSAIPSITITPAGLNPAEAAPGDGAGMGGFGAALTTALQGVIDTGHTADAKSMQAIAGGGSLTDTVTAVSKAELALQTTLAIRDRAMSSYQDVMRMAI